MAEDYAHHGVSFAFLYTREAHPGDKYPHHTSFEQKLAHARDMVSLWGIRRKVLVDDLDGAVHCAYGTLPNMTYIVGAGGRILYRADWTDPRTIGIALSQLVYERKHRRAGTRMTPYYQEWQPRQVNDRMLFMEGLLRDVGRSAVEDFIAAVAHSQGDKAASVLRARWGSRRPSEPGPH